MQVSKRETVGAGGEAGRKGWMNGGTHHGRVREGKTERKEWRGGKCEQLSLHWRRGS